MSNVVTQNFDAKFHRAPFRKFTMEGMEDIPRVHGRYLNVMSTDNEVEQDVLTSGLGAVPKVNGDLLRTPLSSFSTSDPVSYRQEQYRQQYVYTFDAARKDKTGTVTGVVRSMGESAAYTIEVVAADILNLNTSTTGGVDNKALAATDHALLDGTTYSNITVAGGPNFAMLQTIYNYFRKGIKNDNGRIVPIEIECIEVAPELLPAWRQLLSSNTQVGQDNPNVINPYGSMLTADRVQENVYLTGSFDTHVIGRGHHLNMFVFEAPRTRTWNEDDPEAIHHWIGMQFVVGWTDARRYLFVPGS